MSATELYSFDTENRWLQCLKIVFLGLASVTNHLRRVQFYALCTFLYNQIRKSRLSQIHKSPMAPRLIG